MATQRSGNYTIVKELAKGSFGRAYLAFRSDDTTRQRHVVIKQVCISELDRKDKAVAIQEARLLGRLRHPYIIELLESFEEGGKLCMVMPYASRGDLHGFLKRRKGKLLPEPQVLSIFAQICKAVKYLHERRILHRDIKSQNVFLMDGEDGVRLGDFGIARVLQNTLECARTAIGTPYYLSPEICEGKPYSRPSDVWSLGCLLYELCTLRCPFDANNMRGLVVRILRGTFPPLPHTYSPALSRLIDAMLTRDVHRRPTIGGILSNPLFAEQSVPVLVSRAPSTTRPASAGRECTPARAAPLRRPTSPRYDGYTASSRAAGRINRPSHVAATPVSSRLPCPTTAADRKAKALLQAREQERRAAVAEIGRLRRAQAEERRQKRLEAARAAAAAYAATRAAAAANKARAEAEGAGGNGAVLGLIPCCETPQKKPEAVRRRFNDENVSVVQTPAVLPFQRAIHGKVSWRMDADATDRHAAARCREACPLPAIDQPATGRAQWCIPADSPQINTNAVKPKPTSEKPLPEQGRITRVLSEALDVGAFLFQDRSEGADSSDSVHQRVEELREYIERHLGTTRTLRLHRLLVDGDESLATEDISSLLGSENIDMYPLMVQLIACESSVY